MFTFVPYIMYAHLFHFVSGCTYVYIYIFAYVGFLQCIHTIHCKIYNNYATYISYDVCTYVLAILYHNN